MFCKNCGHEIGPNDRFCRNCGSQVDEFVNYNTNHNMNYNRYYTNTSVDRGSIGLGILSFFFPIVGLILFLCWKKEKPLTAKHCGIGALISVIITVVVIIFLCIMLATSISQLI